MLLARNQNIPLVSVAAIVQKPLTSIISLGSKHITSPADLRGKTVAIRCDVLWESFDWTLEEYQTTGLLWWGQQPPASFLKAGPVLDRGLVSTQRDLEEVPSP